MGQDPRRIGGGKGYRRWEKGEWEVGFPNYMAGAGGETAKKFSTLCTIFYN